MKKIIIALLITVAIFIGSLIAIPLFFKDDCLKKITTIINNNIDSELTVGDFKLSFFRSFPKLEAQLIDCTLTGKNDFEGDTLASIGNLSTTLGLRELFRGEDFEISEVALTNAKVYLKVNADNKANWDIVPVSDEEPVIEEKPTANAKGIALNSILVQNLNLIYTDETMNFRTEIHEFNMEASGKYKNEVTDFDINAAVKELVVEYDSVKYISNTSLTLNSQLIAYLNDMKFEFGKSELKLNQLPIELSGSFEMPTDTMKMNIDMTVLQSNFKTILALVPESYLHYLDGVTANGDAGFTGKIKGEMYGDNYPAMDLNLYIKNADLQYTDLPEKVKNINLDARISQPQGSLNQMKFELTQAHAEISSNPIDARLILTNMLEDMNFDAALTAQLNFSTIKNAIPLDSIQIDGELTGNLNLKGIMSAIEKEEYQKITADGKFIFKNFFYKSAELKEPLIMKSGTITLNERLITMNNFAAQLGKSDFTLNGKLSNYLGYFFKNQELSGELDLYSKLLDCNELMTVYASEETTTQTAQVTTDSIASTSIFVLPEHLNLAFKTKVNQLVFDNMTMSNLTGLLTLRNQELRLNNLNLNMLEGKLGLNGYYIAKTEKEADFNFKVDMDKFTIPAAYQSFTSMQRYLPIAKNTSGNLSADFDLSGKFDPTFEIIAKSLNGSGKISTQGVQLAKTETIEQLNLILKTEKLNKLYVDDFSADFQIKDGNVLVKPFQTKIAGQEVNVKGDILVDQTVNLNLNFNINKNDLNSNVANVLNVIPGANKIDIYPIGLNIKGDIQKPAVSPDLTDAKNLIAEELKKSAKENAGKVIDEVGSAIKGLLKK